MKTLCRRFLLLLVVLSLTVGVLLPMVGCGGEPDSPVESISDAVEDAAESGADAAEDAAETAEDAME